jgi:multisubunit Na+/H+ antiporter MnhC subunit
MTASLALIVVMAVLYAAGIYLMLERSLTRVLFGFLLVGNATNLLILIVAGVPGAAPIVDGQTSPAEMTDPLPEALILTAIVITFGVSAFLLALIYRSWRLANRDDVQDDDADVAMRSGPGVSSVTVEQVEDVDDVSEFGEAAEALKAAKELRDAAAERGDPS